MNKKTKELSKTEEKQVTANELAKTDEIDNNKLNSKKSKGKNCKDITSITKAKRVWYLFRLQMSEKFKHTMTFRGIFYSTALQILGIIAVSVVVYLLLKYFNAQGKLDLDENVLSVFICLFFVVSLISSLSTINTFMYKASDNEFLFAMPVQNDEVYLSKFLIVCLQEIKSSFTLLLPFFLGFGLAISSPAIFTQCIPLNANYVITAILLIFTLPLLTVGLAMLLSIVLKFFMDFIKKNFITTIIFYIVLLIALILLLNLFINAIIGSVNFLNNFFALMGKIQNFLDAFNSNTWLFGYIAGILNGNYIHYIYLLLCSGAIFVIAYFAIKPIYFKFVLTGNQIRYSKIKYGINYKQSKPFVSMIKKEGVLLLQGNEFFKSFAMAVVAPFAILFTNTLLNSLEVSKTGEALIIGSNFMMMAILMLISCIYVANSISKEGKNLYIQKINPQGFKLFTLLKMFINFVVIAISLLICVIIAGVMNKFSVGICIVMYLSILILATGHILLSYRYELSKPMLDWHDEAELKNNKNVAKSSIVGMVIGLIFGVFALKFFYIAPATRACLWLIILACAYLLINLHTLITRFKYYQKRIEG